MSIVFKGHVGSNMGISKESDVRAITRFRNKRFEDPRSKEVLYSGYKV